MEYLTKTQLTKRWSNALIERYFPYPTEEKPNPQYKCGAPMQLYDINKVKRIESTKTFKADYKKVYENKVAARERAKRKREELIMYANGVQISIPFYEKDELIKKACDHYNWWNDWKEWEYGDFRKATPSSDHFFLKRICINYLRHQCTCYDVELGKFYRKVGVHDAHDVLQSRINEGIKQKYEWLR